MGSGFRIDRIATLYMARPLIRYRTAATDIPILMYHSISDDETARKHPYYRTVTSPQVFAEQMAFLHEQNYSTIGLDELDDQLSKREDRTRRVVVTFDDGYRDFYCNAFPILYKYGLKATVFLPTRFIADSRSRFNNRHCLTWSEVRELQSCGVTFGSHTVTHPQLRDVDPRASDEELLLSKRAIEDELATEVRFFAYPFAFPENDTIFKDRLRRSLQAAGYTGGVCTSIGRVNGLADRYFMRRLPINSCDDARLFEAKLAGAYDWVAKPQQWVKAAKRWMA